MLFDSIELNTILIVILRQPIDMSGICETHGAIRHLKQ